MAGNSLEINDVAIGDEVKIQKIVQIRRNHENFSRSWLQISTENASKIRRTLSMLYKNFVIMKSCFFSLQHILRESPVFLFSQICQATTMLKKVVWILIFLMGLVGCICGIKRILNFYLMYPNVITLEEEHPSNLMFPAVTVCNLNRMMFKYQQCDNIDISERGCLPIFRSKPGGITITERRNFISCSSFPSMEDNEDTIKDFLEIDYFSRYLSMSEKTRQLVGHQVFDMILYCAYDFQLCSPGDISHFQSLRYGNCYTFKKPGLTASTTGYKSGLELLLNVDNIQYMMSSVVGLRVSVHDVLEPPNPEESGLYISPGFETSIALKQNVVKRLPSPYVDNCVNYKTRTNVSSQDDCERKCFQERCFNACGCIDPTVYWMPDMEHCDFENKTQVCCLDYVLDEVTKKEFACRCPLPCDSIYFDKQTSTANFPSKGTYFLNKTKVKNSTYLGPNFALLKVYYSSLSRNVYTQLPKYEFFELISYIGGEMSLWLGISLFVLFELAELILIPCFLRMN